MRFFKRKTVQEINRLSDYYRSEVFSNEALELLKKEDFSNLIKVSKYSDFGVWTAIEAAFCLGYKSGKAGAEHE